MGPLGGLTRGKSTQRMRRERGGTKEKGTVRCTCRGGGGAAQSIGSTPKRGWLTRDLYTTPHLHLSLMVFPMLHPVSVNFLFI